MYADMQGPAGTVIPVLQPFIPSYFSTISV